MRYILIIFAFLQSFPREYAQCSCTSSGCGTDYDLCGLSFNSLVNLTHGLIPPSTGTFNPVHVAGTDVHRFSFTGSSSSTTSYYTMDTAIKNAALDFTDNFSVSVWIKCNDNSRTSQYVFSFDNDTAPNTDGRRAFTWRLRENRFTLFYTRDRLPSLPPGQADLGVYSRVGLSFFFQSAVIPTGSMYDSQWHFYKLDISYPSIKLFVDGYVHYATEGHYYTAEGFNSNGFERLTRITDGSGTYDMPARLSVKINKADIVGRIGGSSRFLSYGFNGELRLLFMTSLMNNSQYTCLASCGNSLIPSGYTPGTGDVFNNTIGSFTNIFYQPVSRTLYFTNNGGTPSEYTAFVRNISFHTNGHLPAQTVANMGEGRRIELQVI